MNTTRLPLPPKTPELDKERATHPESQHIGQFIEWIQQRRADEEIGSMRLPGILYEYFGIDAEKCERERSEILAHVQLCNAQKNIRAELGLAE